MITVEIVVDSFEVVEVIEEGPAGPAGYEIVNITDNHLPMVLGGALVDSNLRVDEGGTLVVGLSSVQYGEAHRASSAGENIVTTNLFTGYAYHPVWQTLGEGNTGTVRVRGANLPPIVVSADVLDIVNPVWSQGASAGNQTIRSTKFIVVQAQPTATLIVSLDGIEVYSEMINSLEVGEYTHNFLGNTDLTPSGVDLKSGQMVGLSLLSDDGDIIVRGDSLGGELIPYQEGVIALWEDKAIVTADEIVPLKGITVRTAWKSTGTPPEYQLCLVDNTPQPIIFNENPINDSDGNIEVDLSNGEVLFKKDMNQVHLSLSLQVLRDIGGSGMSTWGLFFQYWDGLMWQEFPDSTLYLNFDKEARSETQHLSYSVIAGNILAGTKYRIVQLADDVSKDIGLISYKPFPNTPLSSGAVLSITCHR